MQNKVLFISSTGGHFVQLLRVLNLVNSTEISVALAAPYEKYDQNDIFFTYFNITDFSRDNIFKVLSLLKQLFRINIDFKPDTVISTGAAPGLIACFFFRILCKKVIWIDSIANSEKISLSGKVASYFCNHTLTQWPELSSGRIKYVGRVI
jgi:UDP-N-acetylglucosamine:LPS N-acetylglucosamine transferase